MSSALTIYHKQSRTTVRFLAENDLPVLTEGKPMEGQELPPKELILKATATSMSKSHHGCSRWSRPHRNDTTEGTIDKWLFVPWSQWYKAWWGVTLVCAGLTAFFETYQIAFGTSAFGDPFDASSIIEYILSFVFFIDIVVNFNLAYHGENNVIVVSREKIVKNYLQLWFWIDFMGLFPFYAVALGLSGHLGDDNKITQCLAFLRLFRLIRLYRFKQLVTILQYSMRVSLMWLTLFRNFGVALVWTHFAACFFYFIARQYDFAPDNTWIGSLVEDLNGSERYLTSLYWAVITFTTVGYGDFSPVNSAEQIWGMVYMLLNMIIQAWFIGSITLIIVKGDEETNEYRDTVHILNEYSALHSFDRNFRKRLVAQLKLVYNSREISDEQVLKPFPSSVRRKVLRRLYLQPLLNTSLMKGIREQFVDAFLTTCNVEIFSPGEEVLHRGSISSDLYLLVEGVVKLLASSSTISENYDTEKENTDPYGTSIADSEMLTDDVSSSRLVNAGEFINEIGFFTETPQTDTVRTLTICKTLTMSQSAYKLISQDHPGSVGKILDNLLQKAEQRAVETESEPHFFALTAIRDLIKMHINKRKDDNTTRFLFAASRGDIPTIRRMCDQGFDPNTADYDSRTALMVACMKGNTDTVKKILEYHANPNLVDMHGTSALFEATKHGHEDTMELLLAHGAELCMGENQAASTLCQAVFDGDILMLKRLVKAKIQVNASDYDKRTAVHIAASEANMAALKVLVEVGSADLSGKDRWGHSVYDEASKTAKAQQLLSYLKTKTTAPPVYK